MLAATRNNTVALVDLNDLNKRSFPIEIGTLAAINTDVAIA